MVRMKVKLAASFLAIILFVSAFAVFPFVDAGKGIRVVGSMKDDGRILVLVQNASDQDLHSLMIQSFSGNILRLDQGGAGFSSTNKLMIKMEDNPEKSKNSMRFYVGVDSDEPVLKFKWTVYSSDLDEIAKGAFTVKDPLAMVFDYSKLLPRSLCQGHAECFNSSVTAIVDGDTIDVGHGIRVRLALVNTPEVGQPLYKEAKQFTASLCPIDSNVLIDQDDGQIEGSYGRMIAKVFCGDMKVQKVLNAELLYASLAVIDQRFCNDSEFASEEWAQHYGCGPATLEEQEESTPSQPPSVTPTPPPSPPPSPPKETESNCDPSYPDVCIPPPPPDLDCPDVPYKNFRVLPPDPHKFDGDKDGIGCEK